MKTQGLSAATAAAASLLLASFLHVFISPVPAAAQEESPCRIICTPDLAFEPTLSIENLAGKHRTGTVEDGLVVDTIAADRESTFEIILAMGIPTEIPRVDLALEVIWAPFAATGENPFTGRTADELGRDEIRDNPVELEGELNVVLVTPEETDGWIDAHFDVVDQFSPAEQPDAASVFTHKLNLELDVATAPFQRIQPGTLVDEIEVEGSLDYMVTGLPRAGDRFGDEVFLDDASPWSLSLVLVIPLTP